MKSFKDLVAEHEEHVDEIMPWDLAEKLANNKKLYLLDIREPNEFASMHIKNSINVPRGILESACDYGYSETIPELVQARETEIVVICRSGNRSVLAAHTMKQMGYAKAASLKTGLKGWNDYEQTLVDGNQMEINPDTAEKFLSPKIKPEQIAPVNQG